MNSGQNVSGHGLMAEIATVQTAARRAETTLAVVQIEGEVPPLENGKIYRAQIVPPPSSDPACREESSDQTLVIEGRTVRARLPENLRTAEELVVRFVKKGGVAVLEVLSLTQSAPPVKPSSTDVVPKPESVLSKILQITPADIESLKAALNLPSHPGAHEPLGELFQKILSALDGSKLVLDDKLLSNPTKIKEAILNCNHEHPKELLTRLVELKDQPERLSNTESSIKLDASLKDFERDLSSLISGQVRVVGRLEGSLYRLLESVDRDGALSVLTRTLEALISLNSADAKPADQVLSRFADTLKDSLTLSLDKPVSERDAAVRKVLSRVSADIQTRFSETRPGKEQAQRPILRYDLSERGLKLLRSLEMQVGALLGAPDGDEAKRLAAFTQHLSRAPANNPQKLSVSTDSLRQKEDSATETAKVETGQSLQSSERTPELLIDLKGKDVSTVRELLAGLKAVRDQVGQNVTTLQVRISEFIKQQLEQLGYLEPSLQRSFQSACAESGVNLLLRTLEAVKLEDLQDAGPGRDLELRFKEFVVNLRKDLERLTPRQREIPDLETREVLVRALDHIYNTFAKRSSVVEPKVPLQLESDFPARYGATLKSIESQIRTLLSLPEGLSEKGLQELQKTLAKVDLTRLPDAKGVERRFLEVVRDLYEGLKLGLETEAPQKQLRDLLQRAAKIFSLYGDEFKKEPIEAQPQNPSTWIATPSTSGSQPDKSAERAESLLNKIRERILILLGWDQEEVISPLAPGKHEVLGTIFAPERLLKLVTGSSSPQESRESLLRLMQAVNHLDLAPLEEILKTFLIVKHSPTSREDREFMLNLTRVQDELKKLLGRADSLSFEQKSRLIGMAAELFKLEDHLPQTSSFFNAPAISALPDAWSTLRESGAREVGKILEALRVSLEAPLPQPTPGLAGPSGQVAALTDLPGAELQPQQIKISEMPIRHLFDLLRDVAAGMRHADATGLGSYDIAQFMAEVINGLEDLNTGGAHPQREVTRKALESVKGKSATPPPQEQLKVATEILKSVTALENTIKGQELLSKLNPLLQAAGEPMMLLFPTLIQGYLSSLELVFYPISEEQVSGERNKKKKTGAGGYQQAKFGLNLPALGHVQVSVAHGKKGVLLSMAFEREEFSNFVSARLGKLRRSLKEAGIEKLECKLMVAKPTSIAPRWVKELSERVGIVA
ncbi:MAG: flagellar hook-length control protein FliK [Deltaproteobacteria bacterium]|nr:flagellar hook-length control protein FliK [Deltaproteobacteria bacterium]